jgi:MFS family permease
MSDWIGREKIVTIASILSISGLIALILVKDTSQPWLLYLYAICFGYGAGLSSSTIYAGMADIFHGKYFGSIGGLMMTGFAITGVIGPWLGGYIYDISGSYISPFLFSMVCLGLSSVLFWIAGPRKAIRL